MRDRRDRGGDNQLGAGAQGETKEWSWRGAREWAEQSRAEEGLGFLGPAGFWFLCSESRMSEPRCSFHSATSAGVWQSVFTLYSPGSLHALTAQTETGGSGGVVSHTSPVQSLKLSGIPNMKVRELGGSKGEAPVTLEGRGR